ncbi:MAG: hypothetical protein QOC64_3301 [Solirubrobacteraceae bacterium]|jgi:hypothetical protein|nr:hypothetical protein [Solirubrobacteraceae bacterium]
MTAVALSPPAALAWLRSLSVDLSEAVVLDAAGAVLAGDSALAPRVVAALGPPGARTGAEGADVVDAGDLLAVRSRRHAVAAAVGAHALRRLALADLRGALDALEGV